MHPAADPRRAYRGPLRAVIFDWAGTTVDFGSCAPVLAFAQAFADVGIELSLEEIRADMGLPKLDHVRKLRAVPRVAQRWESLHGAAMSEADVERVYLAFVERQAAQVAARCEPIPGVLDVVAALRARGIRVGSNSGYPRAVMDRLAPAAAERGYAPDVIVCGDEVTHGRPAPFMAWRALELLGVWPAAACVKVDDTLPGVEEGLNAGMWTVAVAMTGNELALTAEELEALPALEREARREEAYRRLAAAGAHYVVDSAADLPDCIDQIENRLERGEAP
jgi:phosphonoacetaldehyde hydrolase